MNDQDRLDAYNEGFDDGQVGHSTNPYFPDYPATSSEEDLWKTYWRGYREGVAEKKRAGNE